MNPRRILCPVDFSECSQRALQYACRQAEEHEAKLFIVHVEAAGQAYVPGTPGYVEELDEHKRLIAETKPCSDNVDYEQHYLRGNVIDEIQRFARVRECDLLVMGTHGRSGLARALMGSVADAIAGDAPCEVVTIPPTDANVESQ